MLIVTAAPCEYILVNPTMDPTSSQFANTKVNMTILEVIPITRYKYTVQIIHLLAETGDLGKRT